MFRKSLILAANNQKVALKALACQVCILALAVACCYLFFGSVTEDIVNVFAAGEWGKFLTETVKSVADATFDGDAFAQGLADCIEKTRTAIEAIPNMWNQVEISYALFFVIVLFYRVLIASSDVAVSFQLNEFMNSDTARPFTWFLFKKFWESLKFSLLQTAVALPLDFVTLSGAGVIMLVFALTLRWWAIIPAAVILLVMYSIRLAFLAFWLPAVSEGELKISAALKKGLATIPYRFWHVFWKTFLLIILMSAIFVVGIVFIENSILAAIVCIVPNLVIFFLLKCVNFVEYYEALRLPYFYRHVDVEGTERYKKKHKKSNANG